MRNHLVPGCEDLLKTSILFGDHEGGVESHPELSDDVLSQRKMRNHLPGCEDLLKTSILLATIRVESHPNCPMMSLVSRR